MPWSVDVNLFDVFGTTVDWHTGLATAFVEVAGRRGLSAPGSELAIAWHHAYTTVTAEVHTGKRPWVEFDCILKESLDSLLEQHGLGCFNDTDRKSLIMAWSRLPPWPDTVPGLTRIKQACVIAPLSNGNFAMLTELAKHCGLPWDAIISAELFHQYKTHADVYLGACDLLRRKPENVMLVACHQPDLDAARAAGLRTTYVHRPGEFGKPSNPPPQPPEADVVVSDFFEYATEFGL